jgi:hypothetical protein
MGNPRRMGCSTLGQIQVGSKVRTTSPLDEKTPVLDRACWSLAGEDYKTSNWAQSRGKKEEVTKYKEYNCAPTEVSVPYGNNPG